MPAMSKLSDRVDLFAPFRLRSTYFSLLSGVLVGAAVNLLTSVAAPDVLPLKWQQMCAAGIALLFAAVLLAEVATEVERIHLLAASAPSDEGEPSVVWERVAGGRLTRLWALLMTVALITALAFGALFWKLPTSKGAGDVRTTGCDCHRSL